MSTNDDSAWATPLTNNNKLVIKIFTFGMAALVGSSILGFAIYYVFFRKGHRERKAARKEEVVCSPDNLASFIVSYDILL